MLYGVQIRNNTLNYIAFPKETTGIATYCKPFSISLSTIKLIALSSRLALDNEVLFILIITNTHKIYTLPPSIITQNNIHKFESYFNLNPIIREWGKFEYEDHYGIIDRVVFPKQHYWKPLFKNGWKLKVRNLYIFLYPNSFWGNLNSEVL